MQAFFILGTDAGIFLVLQLYCVNNIPCRAHTYPPAF